jgi:hypothetical protein
MFTGEHASATDARRHSPSGSPLAFASVFTRTGRLLVADDGAAGTSGLSGYRIAAPPASPAGAQLSR